MTEGAQASDRFKDNWRQLAFLAPLLAFATVGVLSQRHPQVAPVVVPNTPILESAGEAVSPPMVWIIDPERRPQCWCSGSGVGRIDCPRKFHAECSHAGALPTITVPLPAPRRAPQRKAPRDLFMSY